MDQQDQTLDIALLESKSLDIDFIDEKNLRALLEPDLIPENVLETDTEEQPLESSESEEIEPEVTPPVEEPPEVEIVVEESAPEGEPSELEQELEEEIPDEPDLEDPFADEEIPEEISEEEVPEIEENQQAVVPELDIEVPDQKEFGLSTTEGLIESGPKPAEVIKSAVELRKQRREQVQKRFTSVVKSLKVDLKHQSKEVEERARQKSEEQKSEKRVKKVKTIVTDNSDLFRKRQIVAKWKHYDMSSVKQQKYAMAVSEFIKPYWNLPMELDPNLVIKVRFKIAKSGQILDYEIVESSESRLFNAHVLQVIKNLDHLPPLPEEFKGESTNYGMTFRP